MDREAYLYKNNCLEILKMKEVIRIFKKIVDTRKNYKLRMAQIEEQTRSEIQSIKDNFGGRNMVNLFKAEKSLSGEEENRAYLELKSISGSISYEDRILFINEIKKTQAVGKSLKDLIKYAEQIKKKSSKLSGSSIRNFSKAMQNKNIP